MSTKSCPSAFQVLKVINKKITDPSAKTSKQEKDSSSTHQMKSEISPSSFSNSLKHPSSLFVDQHSTPEFEVLINYKKDCLLYCCWLYGNQEMLNYSYYGAISKDVKLCKAPETIYYLLLWSESPHEHTLQQSSATKHLLGVESRPSSLAKCFMWTWTGKAPSALSCWGGHNKNKWSRRKEMPSKQRLAQ